MIQIQIQLFYSPSLQQRKCLESGKHTNISKQQHWHTSTSIIRGSQESTCIENSRRSCGSVCQTASVGWLCWTLNWNPRTAPWYMCRRTQDAAEYDAEQARQHHQRICWPGRRTGSGPADDQWLPWGTWEPGARTHSWPLRSERPVDSRSGLLCWASWEPAPMKTV